MPTLEEIIDDYLHVIVRTRPWTKKREAEALTTFAAWLRGRWSNSGNWLACLTPALARHSATERGLDARERDNLLAALDNLLAWARAEGLLEGITPSATPLGPRPGRR